MTSNYIRLPSMGTLGTRKPETNYLRDNPRITERDEEHHLELQDESRMYQSDSKNTDLIKVDGMERRWSSPNVNRYFLQRFEV